MFLSFGHLYLGVLGFKANSILDIRDLLIGCTVTSVVCLFILFASLRFFFQLSTVVLFFAFLTQVTHYLTGFLLQLHLKPALAFMTAIDL